MTVVSRLAGLIGLGGARDTDPPRYRAIAPGVIVTETEAWAWYEIDTTNSDLLGESGRDAEQDLAEVGLRTLVGRECHLRVLWGRIDGDTYLHGLGLDAADENAKEWAAARADDIDDLALPDRRVLLGVKIADRTPSEAGNALGLSSPRLPDGDLARYSAMAIQLGGPLRATAWRVRLASAELLAWSISRELHRSTVVPRDDTITGAPLARLTAGRVEFGPDHFVVLSPSGAGACFGTVLALSDFPEVLVTPGQEWLALLGMVETSPLDAEATAGGPILVLPEASVRFTVPSFRASRKAVGEARRAAKEQRQSAAKTSAGEPEESILTAEDELRGIEFSLSRRHTLLVNDHPRIVVTGRTRAELDAKTTALVSAYDEIGVTAVVMADEQREGWLETLPCDRVRVPDLGHWRDATAFAQSWFWGGSRVGSSDPVIPSIGYTTGTTSSLVRYLATEAVAQSDAPVTALTGRTRRGKTTLMQLACLDVCLAPANADRNPWVVLVDFKGDADGVVTAAREYGVAADLIQVGPAYAGVLDAFATSDPEHAVENVVGALSLCLPRHLADQATSMLQRAAAQVRAHPGARSWQVVENLVQDRQRQHRRQSDPRRRRNPESHHRHRLRPPRRRQADRRRGVVADPVGADRAAVPRGEPARGRHPRGAVDAVATNERRRPARRARLVHHHGRRPRHAPPRQAARLPRGAPADRVDRRPGLPHPGRPDGRRVRADPDAGHPGRHRSDVAARAGGEHLLGVRVRPADQPGTDRAGRTGRPARLTTTVGT